MQEIIDREKFNFKDVKIIAASTNICPLKNIRAKNKILYGRNITHGLGTGGNPQIGDIALKTSIKKIEEVIRFKKTKQLILVAGMGGGAGSTALAYLSKLAHEKGIKVVAIITKPLKLEGKIRILKFRKYFKKIHNNCDKIILLNNEKLANFCQKLGDTSIHQVFDTATDCLANLIIQELLKKIPNYRICEFLPTKKDGILGIDYKKIEA